MAMDDAMMERLNGIKRSYQALTERLGDPDVIADSKLLMKIMSDRSKSEDVVNAFDEVSFLASIIFILKLGLALSLISNRFQYSGLKEELEGAKELFQEAGDDPDMKEMAREEIKQIETRMAELEEEIQILLLPKDPNDDRNVMVSFLMSVLCPTYC